MEGQTYWGGRHGGDAGWVVSVCVTGYSPECKMVLCWWQVGARTCTVCEQTGTSPLV